MTSWLPVLTALVGAAVAAGGFLISARRQRRETLDTRVERAVKSQIGERFMDFLEVGERTAKEMAELTEDVRANARTVIAEAQERLAQLEAGSAAQGELVDLLARADRVLPNLDELAAATPAALLRELSSRQIDPARATAVLVQIRDHPSVSSKQLERAGDTARDLLEDYDLARELYERSVLRNSSNISAQAELLAMSFFDGDDALVAESMDGLRSLIRAHPRIRTPLIKLLNEFTHLDQYPEMEAEIRDLLGAFPDDALLWRNLALALAQNRRNADEVGNAFERAIDLSSSSLDAEGDYVNSATLYISWLAHQQMFERADEILAAALRKMPQEDTIYFASFKLDMARGDLERARRALDMMGNLGGPSTALLAAQLKLGLESAEYLEKGGSALPGGAPAVQDAIRSLLQDVDADTRQ